MTATIPITKVPGGPGRFRLSTMEVLGFIDAPGVATASAPIVAAPMSHPAPRLAPPKHIQTTALDPFADWLPQEVGPRFARGRVRWGLLISIILLLAVVGAAAGWLYQRPQIEAAQARAVVQAAAATLEPEMVGLTELNQTLAGPSTDAAAINQAMLDLERAVRALFEAGANLDHPDAVVKSTVLEIAGEVSEAQRLFSDAQAYRAALIPVLAPPDLETDPDLVTLEDAAASFSEWQARFESVRTALPSGILPEVNAGLDGLAAEIGQVQRLYLDALGDRDLEGAMLAVGRIEEGLGGVEDILFASLAATSDQVDSLIRKATEGIEALPSLLG
ncbi:MAG: hypothetical protein WD269_12395 [Acidimicrobiia bacterium]